MLRLLIDLLHFLDCEVRHFGFLLLLSFGLLESLPPKGERVLHHLRAVVRVEKSGHCVQQVFVLLKVMFLTDQVELESVADVRIFELFVGSQIFHEFFEHFVGAIAILGFLHIVV